MVNRQGQDERGGLLLFILLLIAFALLIALPVLQLSLIEYQAAVTEQIALQAHYLAEAGLVKAQQLLTLNMAAPLPSGEQYLGSGTYRLERADNQIVAVGRVGRVRTSLALSCEPLELSQGYLVCVTGAEGVGYLSLKGGAQAQVEGSLLVDGDLYVEADAHLTVARELRLTGQLSGAGSINLAPNWGENPLAEEIWLWWQQQLLQSGSPLPPPRDGRLQLEPGKVYECSSANWVGLQVIGPPENEPAATLIVRGQLDWLDCRGNINLLVTGDCQQALDRAGVIAIDGVVWVQGLLAVHNLQVRGALIASSLQVHAGPMGGCNLLVQKYPRLEQGAGLVVPRFHSWQYRFD